jgi:hypothetical protein
MVWYGIFDNRLQSYANVRVLHGVDATAIEEHNMLPLPLSSTKVSSITLPTSTPQLFILFGIVHVGDGININWRG